MCEIVSFDLAKKLKEKGFNYPCFNAINAFGCTYKNGWCEYLDDRYNELITLADLHKGDYLLPTISQVLKWLRKKKKIFVTINIGYCYESDKIPFPTNPNMEPILKGYYYGIWELDNLNDKNGHSEYFETPELAAIAGIEYVLDNLI